MTRETSQDPRIVYADILHLPHPVSRTHPRMSLYDRAAQFAPFAALAGYDEMVGEEARLTDAKIEPGESDLEVLNQKFRLLAEALGRGTHPRVTITHFVPDPLKAGGSYQTVTERIRRIDPVRRQVELEKTRGPARLHVTLDFDQILDMDADLFDSLNGE